MMYTKGDTVTIKPWEYLIEEFGVAKGVLVGLSIQFPKTHKHMCGKPLPVQDTYGSSAITAVKLKGYWVDIRVLGVPPLIKTYKYPKRLKKFS